MENPYCSCKSQPDDEARKGSVLQAKGKPPALPPAVLPEGANEVGGGGQDAVVVDHLGTNPR